MTTANKSEKDRVIVFDTTLRDGEQCPGATMTVEEKIVVAEMLDDMGVDVIEAGFPITSEGDFQAVSEIARRSKNAVIAGLSRANPKDIDRCAEAVKFARRGRVHTVIATSPLHMRDKLNMTPEQVVELSVANVTRARNHIDDVEWSAEDGTRSEMDCLGRNDRFPWWNKIDTTMLTRASKLVSAATSFPVQYNKAIVGRNAFAHESGIHQDGVLKDASTYEIMRPETVGLKQSSLVLGKHSGRHAFVHKLEAMGYKLGANQLEDAFVRMKALADRKQHIYDE